MKRNSGELKRLARETLNGQYGVPMGIVAFNTLFPMLALTPFNRTLESTPTFFNSLIYLIAYLLVTIVSIVFSSGNLYVLLKMARKEEYKFSDMFALFKIHPDRYILGYLLVLAITFVITLIPGILTVVFVFTESLPVIIVAIVFWLAAVVLLFFLHLNLALFYYLLIDRPELRVMEAFKTSCSLMKGHKGRFFYINLSFIGWQVLGVLTCGIGLLWIGPYSILTVTQFYRDVTGELDRSQTPPPAPDTYEAQGVYYQQYSHHTPEDSEDNFNNDSEK